MTYCITVAAAAVAAGLISACEPALAQTSAAPPQGDDASLFHRFAVPAKVAWGAISIDLAPGGWRVGHLDGPVASEAQLRAVLSRLTMLEVGGRCAGWVEGPTSYPCGFAIDDLDLGGTVEARFAALTTSWAAPSEAARPDPTLERPLVPDLGAHGLISPVLDIERFVALRAPLRYLGDKSRALGASMQFKFRAVSNALVPSEFDRTSGTVVLRSQPQPDEQRQAAGGGSGLRDGAAADSTTAGTALYAQEELR